MDRLFLDANILFSAAYKVDARLFQLWKLEHVMLYSPRVALEEARINLDDDSQRARLSSLAQKLRFCEASERQLPRGVSLPAKDAPILLAAIEARVDYLLTGDLRDFGPYFGRKIEGVTIIRPSVYMKMRETA